MTSTSETAANKAQGGAALLPLIIGITGHRDIPHDQDDDDVPAIEKSLAAELEKIQAAGPSTPLLLLSPLAESADRIVASLFLRLRAEGKIHQLSSLIVPLPYELEEYKKSFTGADPEFDNLLGQADKYFVVPELTAKWYAALLALPAKKLGLNDDGIIESIDLRIAPEAIAALVDGKRYFPGYHMNKKTLADNMPGWFCSGQRNFPAH